MPQTSFKGTVVKKLACLAFALIAIPSFTAFAADDPDVSRALLVSVKQDSALLSSARLEEINAACGTEVRRTMESVKIYSVEIVDDRSMEDAVRCWKQFPEIRTAQPDGLMRTN